MAGMDNILCRTFKKVLNSKVEANGHLIKKKLEFIKKENRIFACLGYKTLNIDDDVKCGKCLEDFSLTYDGVCIKKCSGNLGDISLGCKYTNKFSKKNTNGAYCKLNKIDEHELCSTGVCQKVPEKDKVKNCKWYKNDIENRAECGSCKRGYILINGECYRKCSVDENDCAKDGKYCKYNKQDLSEGVCRKKTVDNCKVWLDYAAREVCRECVDGYELDRSSRRKCVMKFAGIKLGRMLFGFDYDD